MKIDFEHRQAAHCESGVTSNLLRELSCGKITEPLAFGIGAGLFFVYIPFIKINKGPAIAFRTLPGWIFKRTCRSLGIPVVRKKFSSPARAEAFLQERLNAGQPAGCQVGVYYLSYFPREYRFHFNAHNLVVYGREGDNYLISDPIMEHPTTLTSYELERVRFAKGALAPKGQIYYPQFDGTISDERIRTAIKSGISKNVRNMLHIPGPFAGVKGVRFTAGKIKQWRDKLGLDQARLYLAQLVRMQEEIGTGGAGFRFLYAAFLQEAAGLLKKEELSRLAGELTQTGDLWRNFAFAAGRVCKSRSADNVSYRELSEMLLQCAASEEVFFRKLAQVKL